MFMWTVPKNFIAPQSSEASLDLATSCCALSYWWKPSRFWPRAPRYEKRLLQNLTLNKDTVQWLPLCIHVDIFVQLRKNNIYILTHSKLALMVANITEVSRIYYTLLTRTRNLGSDTFLKLFLIALTLHHIILYTPILSIETFRANWAR